MVQISREDFEALGKAKLLKDSKTEKNFVIVGKNKKSNRKKYYVAVTHSISAFLDL